MPVGLLSGKPAYSSILRIFYYEAPDIKMMVTVVIATVVGEGLSAPPVALQQRREGVQATKVMATL